MKKHQYYIGKTFLLVGSVLIGIPMGVIHGIILFFRAVILHPHILYQTSLYNWLKSNELKEEDIWDRHIERIKRKENNYDN